MSLKKRLQDWSARRYQRREIKQFLSASRKDSPRSGIRSRLLSWLRRSDTSGGPEPSPQPQQPRNRGERRQLLRSLGQPFRAARLNTHMRRPLVARESKYCREPNCKRHHAV